MKKLYVVIIAVVSIVLITFFGWYLFLRNQDIPAGETIRNILPFGSGGDVASRPTTNNSQPTTDLTEPVDEFGNPTATLFPLSNTPVAGAVVLERGNQTIVRYVDRATGHI